MARSSRREFLADVGSGMLMAGLGASLASELGLSNLDAAEDIRLTFGDHEPLVALLQETPKDKLLPKLVEKINGGLTTKQLTAASAFANARTFGGENYFGFHIFMALAPAYQIGLESEKGRESLALLKVLYRNAHYVQEVGGKANEVLKPIAPMDAGTSDDVLKAVNAGDRSKAERLLATVGRPNPQDALDAALLGVEDNHDVHTAVMPWRAWTMLDIVGKQYAVTLLRQSVRQCAKQCADRKGNHEALTAQRAIVPKIMEKFKLPKDAGKRNAEDSWIEKLAITVLTSSQADAGNAVAEALSEGFTPEAIGEAISLASNQLVLRQVETWEGRGGSLPKRTHGDSAGVHASDATNAWRNMVRVCNARNQAAGLILAAMNTAMSHSWKSGAATGFLKEPFPHADHLKAIKTKEPADLLKELDEAVTNNDQLQAMAVVQAYSLTGASADKVFATLRKYAISEDGRLHAEKYYRTVVEEFATTRAAFKWRHLVGLARVTASMYGYSQFDKKEGRAPGYEEACKLLKV